ncbi:minor capsid protein [Microbacterium phage Gingerbug]|nr:minor capsid protein [Microbacterium phage Gingerbug]
MAVSPIFAALLSEEVARIYEDAELRILQRLVAMLSEGITDDWWERDVLERLQTIRQEVLATLAKVNPEAAAAITAALEEAYGIGGLAAYREVGAQAIPVAHEAAVTALATATLGKTVEAAPHLLRSVEDAARTVVAEVLRGTTTGTLLKRDALQRALNGLVRNGFAQVPVGRGRMGAADYARMAVRTGTAQAMIAGHTQALKDLGQNLVTITPGPRACKVCDEWAGKVLSIDGTPAGRYLLPGEGREAEVWVTVDGTLDQARAAGWGHPNCRCAIRAYVVGISRRRDVTERPAWDEKGYQAQQEQRGIERAIRRAKELEAVALTPEAKAAARANVRAAQARMREHLSKHPFLKRQSAREQVLRPDAA